MHRVNSQVTFSWRKTRPTFTLTYSTCEAAYFPLVSRGSKVQNQLQNIELILLQFYNKENQKNWKGCSNKCQRALLIVSVPVIQVVKAT